MLTEQTIKVFMMLEDDNNVKAIKITKTAITWGIYEIRLLSPSRLFLFAVSSWITSLVVSSPRKNLMPSVLWPS